MKKTNWIPLGNYKHAYDDYIVFVRGRKNGMMDFKVKKVQNWTFGFSDNILPDNLINVSEAWEAIKLLMKSLNS